MLKSKHLWHAVLSVLLCGCFLLLPSCSSDEPDSGDNQTDSPEDNLSDAARNFVGYWSLKTGSFYGLLLLYADGHCRGALDQKWGVGDWTFQTGYWAFDEKTNILSTTIYNGFQWQITLSNSETWLGFYPTNNKTTVAEKLSLMSSLGTYVEGSWISGEMKMYLTYSTSRVTFLYAPFELDDYLYQYYMDFSDIEETDGGCVGNYCVYYYKSSKRIDTDIKGTFRYVNAYYYNLDKLIFTGALEGTFTRDQTE